MKNLMAIILATLVVIALATGCSKPAAEPVAPSMSPANASVPQTTSPALTLTATASTPVTPATSPAIEPSPTPEETAEIPVYSWEEAIDHISEAATIIGPIIGTFSDLSTGNLPGLRMGGPQGPVVIFMPPLEPPQEDLYVGHTISVTVSYINPWSVYNDYVPDYIDMTKTKKVGEIMTTIWVRLYVTDLLQIEIIE